MLRSKVFNLSDKVLIVRRISAIEDRKCYIELFKVLINKDINYIRNGNGIFFDVGLLSDDVLNIIENILTFHEIRKKSKMSYTNI